MRACPVDDVKDKRRLDLVLRSREQSSPLLLRHLQGQPIRLSQERKCLVENVPRLRFDHDPRIGGRLGSAHDLAHEVDVGTELDDCLEDLRRCRLFLGNRRRANSQEQKNYSQIPHDRSHNPP